MSYQTIDAGETRRFYTVVRRSNGDPVTTGTVNYYLQAETGVNAGKWWRDSDQTWQASETPNAMTHAADGHWKITLTSSPFAEGIHYFEYMKESGNLHVPDSRHLIGRIDADYPDGFVYLDPVNGVAGTTVGVHGTARNPSDTFANAATIASARGTKVVRFVSRKTVVLSSGTHDGYEIDVNGGFFIVNNLVSLTGTPHIYSSSPGGEYIPHLIEGNSAVTLYAGGLYENLTIAQCRSPSYTYCRRCQFTDSFSSTGNNGTDPNVLESCYTRQIGGMTFNLSGGADFMLFDWYGDLTITNMVAGQDFFCYGWGKLTIAASCTGGTITHTSHVEINDLSGGLVTRNLTSEDANRDILEADRYIDTSTTPWQLVLIKKGSGTLATGTRLLVQNLKTEAGGNVTSISTFIGQSIAP